MKAEPINVIAFCGDGGGADMGLGAISATLTHREYNSLILLYDNESYANTDIQLSGSTPYGAHTTFSPPGKVKRIMHHRWKKNMAGMLAAGHPTCKFVATVCMSYPVHAMNAVRKGLTIGGPTFVHSLDPCPKGWDYDPMLSHELGELAIETGIFPLYEVEDGVVKYYGKTKAIVDGRPRKPVREYLLKQGRFAHFTEEDLGYFQDKVDEQWEKWEIPGVVPFKRLEAAKAALQENDRDRKGKTQGRGRPSLKAERREAERGGGCSSRNATSQDQQSPIAWEGRGVYRQIAGRQGSVGRVRRAWCGQRMAHATSQKRSQQNLRTAAHRGARYRHPGWTLRADVPLSSYIRPESTNVNKLSI